MITSKQRSYLKKLGHNLKPITQIGKEGVSEKFVKQLDLMLESHELVKITVHDNNMLNVKETANTLCETLKAEFVQAIGRKITIYRKAKEDPTIELPRK